jgi:hypothetical protein
MSDYPEKTTPKRKSFAFYWSFKDAMAELENKDDRLAIYEALTDYAFLGIEPTGLNHVCRIIWKLIKPNLESSMKRYDTCVSNGEKGAEYGTLGGRPRKKNPKENPKENPKDNPKENPKENPKDNPKDNPKRKPQRKPHDDNDNVDGDDNVDDNDNFKKENLSLDEKDERKQLSFNLISEEFLNFQKWLKDNCPFVLKVKSQMSEKDYNKLMKKYSKKELCDALESLNNWKDFPKKRTSVYRSTLDELKLKFGERI